MRAARVVAALGLTTLPILTAPAEPASPPEIYVYAAASLRDALEASAPACERRASADLVFNFGASNDLARQIRAARKADVFFSADEQGMDALAAAGLVDRESRRAALSNRLVVVGAPGVTFSIGSAADVARAPARFISLANPEAVPAGRYARAWLESPGQWEAIRERVLPGVDARAALGAVEAGAADLGIVYATDAALSRKVRVLHVVPDEEAPRIRYSIAALLDRPHLETSRAVVACLTGTEAGQVFARLGFLLPSER